MKKRGLSSPDIGDMLAMTFHSDPMKKTSDEAEAELQAKIDDPFQLHLRRYAETMKRTQKREADGGYWEG